MAASFLAGSVPFSQLAARSFARTDLRRVGNGTVSGTALYEVAGFGPLAVAGVLEVAKGAVGPALAGRDRPGLCTVAVAAAVAGHNWSPWLRGAGGRGLSPALGATAVCAPEATALLAAGMAAGRILHRSGAVTFGCALGLVPLLWARRGRPGATLAVAVAGPMLMKRLLGNRPNGALAAPRGERRALVWSRLLYDRDPAGRSRAGD